ncbi:hypothetical protein Lal_00022499 [Lupinus albus]|nr:hypothetical protein Lal_00022499 [Lupinus albus]
MTDNNFPYLRESMRNNQQYGSNSKSQTQRHTILSWKNLLNKSQIRSYCKTPISPTSYNVPPIASFRLKNQKSRTRSPNLSPIGR